MGADDFLSWARCHKRDGTFQFTTGQLTNQSKREWKSGPARRAVAQGSGDWGSRRNDQGGHPPLVNPEIPRTAAQFALLARSPLLPGACSSADWHFRTACSRATDEAALIVARFYTVHLRPAFPARLTTTRNRYRPDSSYSVRLTAMLVNSLIGPVRVRLQRGVG